MNRQTSTAIRQYLNDLLAEIGSLGKTQRLLERIREVIGFIEQQEAQIAQLSQALNVSRTYIQNIDDVNKSQATTIESLNGENLALKNENENLRKENEAIRIKNAEFIEQIANQITEKFIGKLENKLVQKLETLQQNLNSLSAQTNDRLNVTSQFLNTLKIQLNKWEQLIMTLNVSLDEKIDISHSIIRDLINNFLRETKEIFENLNKNISQNQLEIIAISNKNFEKLTRSISGVNELSKRNFGDLNNFLNSNNSKMIETIMRKIELDGNKILIEMGYYNSLIIRETAARIGSNNNNHESAIIRNKYYQSRLSTSEFKRIFNVKWIVVFIVISIFIYIIFKAFNSYDIIENCHRCFYRCF